MTQLAIERQDFQIGELIPLTDEERTTLIQMVQAGDGPQGPAVPGGVEKLRTSHHALAKLLAQGVTVELASTISGVAVARIAHLKTVPAFQELIAFYTVNESSIQVELVDRMKSVALDALEVVQEKIAEDPSKLKIEELNKLLTTLLDRTGHGPVSTQKSVQLTAAGTIAELRGVIAQENVTIRKTRGEASNPDQTLVGEMVRSSLPAPAEETGGEGSGG